MNQIITALIFAGLMLASSWGINHAQDLGWIGGEPERAMGVVSGLVLIYFGNFLPKQAATECGSCSNAFRMRRFAGQMLMLGGAVSAIIWIIAPANIMALAAMGVIGATLMIVLVRAAVTRTFV